MKAEDLIREAIEINEEDDLGLLGSRLDEWAVRARKFLGRVGYYVNEDSERDRERD